MHHVTSCECCTHCVALQVQSLVTNSETRISQYKHSLHAVRVIVSSSGVSGLFRGYWATNCVWLPWNVIYIASFEAAKRRVREHLKVDAATPLPAAATSIAAALAATSAVVLTHPADVIKTRLQVCVHVLTIRHLDIRDRC
jgi:Mitochondrial carrier protein